VVIRISVIVPFYGAAGTIERCIRSLLDQDYPLEDYEIIAVDNNSVDDSASLIRQFQRVRLLSENRQGSYAARNTGVEESRGQILAFTDADCVPDSNWLKAIDQRMEKERTQAILGSRRSPAERMRLIASYDDARVEYILNRGDARATFAFTNNMAVRRTAFERRGPFQLVDRGADTIFVRSLASAEGMGAIGWEPAMRVTHLELQTFWGYLRKNFIYARARKRTRHFGQCETLSSRECLGVFRRVVRNRSPREKIALAMLLGAGRLSWTLGSL
jgi:glycosyltransferase involved in cell wall biosynthesis